MRHLRPAVLLTAFFVVLTGLLFPAAVWALGRIAFPHQAGGSLLTNTSGTVVGSSLLGQPFTRPEYFHPRPSAAGAGYDAANSGGTNLGPSSAKLIAGFTELAAAYRAENGLAPDALIPADAATRSGSGLDPDISPANALLQVARVAKARGLEPDAVRSVVTAQTQGRALGLFGEPRVNVLLLNLALDSIPSRR